MEPDLLICRCGATYDRGDNYCRVCGLSLTSSATGVPAVRPAYQATVWQRPVPPAVLKAAGAIAAGTIAEFVMRRLASRALSPVRALVPGRSRPARRDSLEEAVILSETLVVRRFRSR